MENIHEYIQQMNGRRILDMKKDNAEKDKDMKHDGYQNLLTRYGTSLDSSTAYSYTAEDIVPDQELTNQYIGNGLFAKIIDSPAKEAVKHGYDFKLNDQKVEDFLSNELDRLNWEENAVTAIKWTRLYGGALIVMLVDDGHDLDEPLEWDSVNEIEELIVYERAIVEPDITSMYSYNPEKNKKRGSKFQRPEYYYVNSRLGGFRVHESRCLIFQNGKVPETGMYSQYLYFGIPEFLRIQTALRESIISHSMAPKLLERCTQAIYKMKNLADLLVTDEGEEKVMRRLEVIDLARGILNSLVIDSEGEDYDFKSMSLAGVKDIIDTTCNMLSAVTNIPQTILFGRSPAGENSTGESDMENYYNYVNEIQKMMLKKNMRILLDIIFKCGQRNGEIQDIPEYKVEFTPLWSLSKIDQANVDAINATTEQTKAATAQMYVDMQVLDPSEVRAGLKKSEEYTINDLLNEEDDLNIADILGINVSDDETETVTEKDQINKNKGRDTENSTGEQTDAPRTYNASKSIHNDELINREGVGILTVREGKILVGDRTDGKGICGPGGHIELGESTEEAAIREMVEEFGVYPLELIFLGTVGSMPPELMSRIFLCTSFEQEPRADNKEMRNERFMSLDEISSTKGNLFKPFEDSIRLLKEKILNE